jgi:hypothetical protein
VKPEKSSRESVPSLLPPLRASEVHASVSLIPPSADGAEVQEKATGENAADMQRYVQLADKLLEGDDKEKQKTKALPFSNAA